VLHSLATLGMTSTIRSPHTLSDTRRIVFHANCPMIMED
jgi:hypothetical protein